MGAKLKITKLKTIRDWFYDNNFANFGNPYENVFSHLSSGGFSDSKSVQDKVVSYFSSFDASIIGFNVEVLKSDDEDRKHIKIDAIHRTIDGGTATIPLEEEV